MFYVLKNNQFGKDFIIPFFKNNSYHFTIYPLKGIVSWLEKNTGPPAVAVNDMETLVKLKGSIYPVIIVGVFKDAQSDAAKEYVKAASKNTIEDVKFVIASDENVIKGIKAADGAIVMFKKFENRIVYSPRDAKYSVSL